jgi:hypothetical protein
MRTKEIVPQLGTEIGFDMPSEGRSGDKLYVYFWKRPDGDNRSERQLTILRRMNE